MRAVAGPEAPYPAKPRLRPTAATSRYAVAGPSRLGLQTSTPIHQAKIYVEPVGYPKNLSTSIFWRTRTHLMSGRQAGYCDIAASSYDAAMPAGQTMGAPQRDTSQMRTAMNCENIAGILLVAHEVSLLTHGEMPGCPGA